MNQIGNFVWKIISIVLATLLGNVIGAQLRTRLTGEDTPGLVSSFTSESGRSYSNFPVATNFYPALLFSFLGKPRWLFAFTGGMLTSILFGQRFEPYVVERIADMTSPRR